MFVLGDSGRYLWLNKIDQIETLKKRIIVPNGYQRVNIPADSYEYWLRHLPLKPENTPVYLHNGKLKGNQKAHYAVIDIDIGIKNLQQCADAVIRLKAEYLYSTKDYDAIHFNFTSGHQASFTKWLEGYRPVIKGNTVRWRKTSTRENNYTSFRNYLEIVFMYAGTYSLNKELQLVDVKNMQIGDVFIKGGSPGHAVIIVDMAIHPYTKNKVFLLAQSYMPAQNIHILNNPKNDILNPWYNINFGEKLQTPEWCFTKGQLKRFH